MENPKTNIDLGINPGKPNPTEERLFALILILKKYITGLSVEKIQSLLPFFYKEDLQDDSVHKKIQRDIQILQRMGFVIQQYDSALDKKTKIYKLISPVESTKIQFTQEELITLSILFAKEDLNEISNELYIALQKIFYKYMDFFPFQFRPKDLLNEDEREKIIDFILTAIRKKSPIKITYLKTFPNEIEEKDLDPIHITKRNNFDTYLLAYDRTAKQNKRFRLNKIIKCQELAGNFIKEHRISLEELNYHALSFPEHEQMEIRLLVNPQNSWKLEAFLYPHPFSKNKNIYSFHITNYKPILNFLWRYTDVVLDIYPKLLEEKYKNYLSELLNLYSF